MINYVSLADLNTDVINSLHKIPHDIDLVVGIPRSGMLVASIIALYLNKPLTDIDSYVNEGVFSVGLTKKVEVKSYQEMKKVLIVDDSVYQGTSINQAKEKIKHVNKEHVFYAVYVSEKNNADKYVDIYSRKLDNRVFEWNVMQHGLLNHMCFDIDGVLCRDPSEEENDDGDKYIEFILNAEPKYIPTKKIGCIVTSRLEKYRDETETWLKNNGIEYEKLMMNPCKTAEERRQMGNHAEFKASVYSQLPDMVLFVESEKWQAIEIAKRCNKQVLCVADQKCYYYQSGADNTNNVNPLLHKLGHMVPSKYRPAAKKIYHRIFRR